MKLTIQKRIAGQILKCSPKRIKLDTTRLEEIKESITKADIRSLIKDNAIVKVHAKGVSRGRARHNFIQKKKGRQRGHGSRKGRQTARLPSKEKWMNTIRLQRAFLKELRENGLLSTGNYHQLYIKAKGGFFRSKAHMKLFMEEHKLVNKK